jgi:hypothetical protein
MKKLLFVSIFAIVTLMSLPFAFGYPVYQGDIVTISDSTGNGPGGEFRVTKGAFSFNSFCLERDEYIMPPHTVKVGSIDTSAIAGGIGGPSPDPLDARTAYLYYHFAIGDLAGYTYGDASSADALQAAIWFIEEEGGASNAFVTLAENAISSGQWSGLGNVRVLNLVNKDTGDNQQSLLTLVPEPMTLLLLGLGLVGLAGLRRKE